jgi:hypothetical protein
MRRQEKGIPALPSSVTGWSCGQECAVVGVYCTISTMVRVVVIAFVLGVAAGAFTVASAGVAEVPQVVPPSSELVLGPEEVCCGESLDRLPARVAAGSLTF